MLFKGRIMRVKAIHWEVLASLPLSTISLSSISIPPTVSPTSINEKASLDLDISIVLRKGTRSCGMMHLIAKFVSYHRLSPIFRAFTTDLSSVAVPRTIKEALNHAKWKALILEEMGALERKKHWGLMNCQKEKIVGCKWVFMVKYKITNKPCLGGKDEYHMGSPITYCKFELAMVAQLARANTRKCGSRLLAPQVWVPMKSPKGLAMEAILIVYVDDIILTRDHVNELEKLKPFLQKSLKPKTWGIEILS
ncbi:hypothetical protein CK203_051642 [Vitis vinifera]|uniref:Reverse transcriptase Ty1/copia-type domain-containing protein n=1 Tax=Vitis vinifera TaxID=29760 RepID=A0A438HBF4_VITVI|nr:hypothetical protein CK203_051642 [Vitis vinifera]